MDFVTILRKACLRSGLWEADVLIYAKGSTCGNTVDACAQNERLGI